MTTETRLTEQDKEWLQCAAKITDDEINRDIDDTLREIAQWQREAEHLAQTPLSLPSSRLDHMRAGARHSQISEATEFVKKLRRVLELRTGAVPDTTGNCDSENTKRKALIGSGESRSGRARGMSEVEIPDSWFVGAGHHLIHCWRISCGLCTSVLLIEEFRIKEALAVKGGGSHGE